MLPTAYSQAIFQFLTEKRAASYIIVAPEAVGPIAPPSDTALAAFVKARASAFSTPEYRQVEYAYIGPDDVAAQIAVTDDQITTYFNDHKSEFNVPEKRAVQQIAFAKEEDAANARAQLDKGLTFDKLADNMKIKPGDLDLGVLTKEDMADPARADAAWCAAGHAAIPRGVVGLGLHHLDHQLARS